MSKTIENFGRNLRFSPREFHAPKTEEDVLTILRTNLGRRLRAMGRLHSWSEAPKADDVLLDLSNLNNLQIETRDGKTYVTAGAGCQIKQVISTLDAAGLALPSQGLITEQTIAGAISTGTHGSGANSLSHYAAEISIAIYDPVTGEPTIKKITEGPELQAARCALGCMGIILSVTLPCQSQYHIEEQLRFHESLAKVLDAEEEFPIQQFFFVPHSWQFMGQHRRLTNKKRSTTSPLYRIYFFICIDVGLHLILLLIIRFLRSKWLVRFFYRKIVASTIVRGWKVVDKSQYILTMEHELFRHIEIEMFVTRSQLEPMLKFVHSVLRYCDGEESAINSKLWKQLDSIKQATPLKQIAGRYTHHYPICIRKVKPDSTLISMASGDQECYYAVSFINYNSPHRRAEFLQFARFLAKASGKLFGARPHWGKVCPIDSDDAKRLYPNLKVFQNICESHDPEGVFRNEWFGQLLFGSDLCAEPDAPPLGIQATEIPNTDKN